ncbi:DUF433 domain-containing protein [Mucilaginibacter arboris]|uniref:DUF433 domain-containing protein n=1 Tax=Mucilaginibacter arboris TaxID=2682090 RepID=A0A7K1SV70_9SPHI|nr:DUF433 domain-containing protein [Mucilaginibacter arboris]MVN20940.1 DUF433 domain-containing protein [Mucilaginibacter arboris]
MSASKPVQNQNGEIIFTGTDTAVSILFNYLKAGKSTEAFLEEYPQINLEQVLDVLELAEDQLTTTLSN